LTNNQPQQQQQTQITEYIFSFGMNQLNEWIWAVLLSQLAFAVGTIMTACGFMIAGWSRHLLHVL